MSPLPSLPTNLVPSTTNPTVTQVTDRFGEVNKQLGSRLEKLNQTTQRLSVDEATKKQIVDSVIDQVVDRLPKTPSGSVDLEVLDTQLNVKIDQYSNSIRLPQIPSVPQIGLLAASLRALPKITIPSPADFIEAKDRLIERLQKEKQQQSINQLLAEAKLQERPFTARLNMEAKQAAETDSVVIRTINSL